LSAQWIIWVCIWNIRVFSIIVIIMVTGSALLPSSAPICNLTLALGVDVPVVS